MSSEVILWTSKAILFVGFDTHVSGQRNYAEVLLSWYNVTGEIPVRKWNDNILYITVSQLCNTDIHWLFHNYVRELVFLL